MAVPTQDAADYYVWEAPGKSVTILLHLDVLERLGGEVMRGFGAVPKRGAEVGGLLIGTVERGEEGSPAVVRIEDFEPVECEYKRGPSYLFSEGDKAVFESAVQRWQTDPERPAHAVGFYRSQTRDGMSLGPEDIELLDERFPGPESVALVVKPYGTKVSEAGFFVRENGKFPETSPLEFPFRRYELTGEEPPPRRSLFERSNVEARQRGGMDRSNAKRSNVDTRQRGSASRAMQPALDPVMEPSPDAVPAAAADPVFSAAVDHVEVDLSHDQQEASRTRPSRGPAAGSAYAVTMPSRSRFSSGVWLPLSFVFLLFGVALGMMISLGHAPKAASGDPQNFSLGLAVSKSGPNLNVKWDPQAPLIRAAQQGAIEIQDGANRPISRKLDTADLQGGGMIYTSSSNTVKFTLTVYPRAQLSVVETVEWRP